MTKEGQAAMNEAEALMKRCQAKEASLLALEAQIKQNRQESEE